MISRSNSSLHPLLPIPVRREQLQLYFMYLHFLLLTLALTAAQDDDDETDSALAAKLAKFQNQEAASSNGGNAPAPAGEQIDWNFNWRYTYSNVTNLTANWEVSCTGFLPVCRPQDLMDGDDIAEMNKNTAGGGNLSSLGENGYFCNENRLEKPTIFLSAGASWESTYIVWIAAILIQELLQIPVTIRENMEANHQFYHRREPQTQKIMNRKEDTLNKIDQSRFLGLEVANGAFCRTVL